MRFYPAAFAPQFPESVWEVVTDVGASADDQCCTSKETTNTKVEKDGGQFWSTSITEEKINNEVDILHPDVGRGNSLKRTCVQRYAVRTYYTPTLSISFYSIVRDIQSNLVFEQYTHTCTAENFNLLFSLASQELIKLIRKSASDINGGGAVPQRWPLYSKKLFFLYLFY